MDEWMRRPGARVVGHRAVVRGGAGALRVECTCGLLTPAALSVESACLALVGHLQHAVRSGAAVTAGPGPEDDGGAGVREPRRPLVPQDPAAVALEPE